MRSRTFVLVAALLVALLVLAGGVYAYDSAREDRIADGITVSGVDVGGLDRREARAKLRQSLLEPLRRPVVATYRGHRFTLTPERARIDVDLDGSVAAAVRRSREGNALTRTFRGLTGGDVDADVPADVTYSRAAVKHVVDRVEKAVERPARDASVDLDSGQVHPRPSRDGIRVRAAVLRRGLEAELTHRSSGERAVAVRTKKVAPKIRTKELADRYPAILVVNRSAFTLALYKHLKLAKTYPIAVGQVGLDTPAGLYHIQNKAVNPAWHVPNSDWAGDLAGQVIPGDDPSNPIKARWLGVYDGVGVHGTADDASIGSAASHGCIRMHIPDVVELYPQVPIGAPIYIA